MPETPQWAPLHGTHEEDLRSRVACILEATYWDRPYDERLSAIRGMCDLTSNGMTPAPDGRAAAGTVRMALAEVLSRWRPGSHDTADTPEGANRAWTWADEAHHLATDRPEYQAGIVDRVRREGVGFLDAAGAPTLLGNDGRVWDGHHRLCAARTLGITLGITHVDVDVVPPRSS